MRGPAQSSAYHATCGDHWWQRKHAVSRHAYAQAGHRTEAAASYREALRLDSTNVHAATMLRRLGATP